jgi:NADH dehydrogenase FAD-containing subunit
MSKKLVLIGGGHAHMVTLDRLESFVERGVDVTVIQPSEYHYYSGMGPGMLGGTYTPDDIRFATKKQVEAKGGRFILGKAERIDAQQQLVVLAKSGEELPYDVLSCNAGSSVPAFAFTEARVPVFQVKPIERLQQAQEQLLAMLHKRAITVAIIGGGPSAIEIAGNVQQLVRQVNASGCRIVVCGGRGLLVGRPRKVRMLARQLLLGKGVEIIDSTYVASVVDGVVALENGESFPADLIFSAIGVRPSPIFSHSGLTTGPDGGLQVNAYLQSTEYANIFGGGDCIYYQPEPLDKVGVYAVRQNLVLYNNLMATLTGGQLEKFSPGGKYLLIYNLGDGVGILSKWSLTISGRLAFLIKDYIDRKFIKTFKK